MMGDTLMIQNGPVGYTPGYTAPGTIPDPYSQPQGYGVQMNYGQPQPGGYGGGQNMGYY